MADRLAIDGGSPVRNEFLPYFRPSIGQGEIDEVVDTLRSGWLTTGPKVQRLEEAFKAYLGAQNAVAVNSGTAALHLALATLDLEAGDEVIVPTYTFAATAEVVVHTGATPVLVDVDPESGNMRPTDFEAAINPRTKAVIPVHIAGQACDMDGINEVANRHGVVVVEDAAHALPAGPAGDLVGRTSRFACFSFYATKNLTTGEGGMLVTTDDEAAARVKRLSLHGLSHDAWDRYDEIGSWYYEIEEPGYKYNLTDIAASLGLRQLDRLGELQAERMAQAERYADAFSEASWIEGACAERPEEHAWHLYIVRLNLDQLTCTRNRFIEALRAENIGASVHFIPLHLHPYYRNRFGHRPETFPNAFRLYERSISLPLYPGLTAADQGDVIDAVMKIGASFAR
ncbi:MAG: DegT/DnrJ/EryC1/StrS family aminotransferase [Chloroflexi bacterium]|nr:DegT/DnrJ/EryC1/StrS family aminotransferase [Chloroflexota bacterium]